MALFVVGMHRSGTKVVADALASLPFDRPNAEGATSLSNFNLDLLERCGTTWLAPSTTALEEMASLDASDPGLATRANELIAQSFSGTAPLLDDARLCLTMPFWRNIIDSDRAVLVLRDPREIAISLRATEGLALPVGLALWERYLRSAVAAIEGMAVHVTSYAEIRDGGQAVDDLIAFASAAEPASSEVANKTPTKTTATAGAEPTELDNAEQTALFAAVSSMRGTNEKFALDLSTLAESPGLDLAFETAAALYRSAAKRTSEPSVVETSVDVAPSSEQENTAQQENTAEQENYELLAAEVDRLRDMLATTELSETRLQERFHIVATELERLKARRAVKYSVFAANGLQKVAALRPSKTSDAPKIDSISPAANRTSRSRAATMTSIMAAMDDGHFDRRLAVIIPVYNAFDAVKRCVAAFDRFTPANVELIIIDDASPDERIAGFLASIADRPNTVVLTNETNQGFTKTVNRGLGESRRDGDPADVIILNSDTVVTPRWTERLRAAAHEDPSYATVTPLSNAAGVFSFESPLPNNPDEAAALSTAMVRGSEFLRPTSPTGNGFCLFVKAEALEVVSELDAEAFPRGYGEENDFCMKLGAAGFTHAIADDVAVFHEESASFGNEAKQQLIEAGLAVLDARYPEYHSLAQAFVASEDFVAARSNASKSIAENGQQLRPRVLTVLHDGGGGTDYHVRDLVGAMRDTHEPLVLAPKGNELILWSADDPDQRTVVAQWSLSKPWDVQRTENPEVRRIAIELLTRFGIELVHVHHLIGHSFDIPRVAKALGIPVAITLHDFYMACPSVNLLDNNNVFCGGTCTAGNGTCNRPMWLKDLPDLKHQFVHVWRKDTRTVLEAADVLITPSEDTKAHFGKIFGSELGERIQAIEHGRDFDRPRVLNRAPGPDEPVKILMVGAINESKGVGLAAELGRLGKEQNVVVEVLGDLEPGYDDAIRSFGRYERDELPARLAARRPTFIGVFSIWAETHCYVISEAWANGIPVLVSPLGAPAERVRSYGGGVIAPSHDPQAIIDLAVKTARDSTGYAALSAQATIDNVRTTSAMAADYQSIYSDLLGYSGT